MPKEIARALGAWPAGMALVIRAAGAAVPPGEVPLADWAGQTPPRAGSGNRA